MADEGSGGTKERGLQQAASLIFALVAVVPLLIFAWALHAFGAITGTQAQLSLGLALAAALLGFWLFRTMLGRVTDVLHALTAVVEHGNRTRRPPAAAVTPAETPPVTATANGIAAPASVHPAPTLPVAARASSTPRPSGAVPGIGKIRELTEVVRTMDALWHREAAVHVGCRVQITVANNGEPLVGTLSEATTDGLILDQGNAQIAVAYGRVTAIDRVS